MYAHTRTRAHRRSFYCLSYPSYPSQLNEQHHDMSKINTRPVLILDPDWPERPPPEWCQSHARLADSMQMPHAANAFTALAAPDAVLTARQTAALRWWVEPPHSAPLADLHHYGEISAALESATIAALTGDDELVPLADLVSNGAVIPRSDAPHWRLALKQLGAIAA